MQRTTIRLDEHLMAQAKEQAARERRSLTSLIEEALRSILNSHRSRTEGASKKRVRLPVSKMKGGFAPRIKDWADVKRVLEEEEIEKYQRAMRRDAVTRR